MSNRKFITILSLSVLVILLGSRIYFGISNFNTRQQFLKDSYKLGDLVSYMADSRELVGLDARNAMADAPLLTPGMSVTDITTIDLQPGNHILVNAGIHEVKLILNGEEVVIPADMTMEAYLDKSSTIIIQEGSLLVF